MKEKRTSARFDPAAILLIMPRRANLLPFPRSIRFRSLYCTATLSTSFLLAGCRPSRGKCSRTRRRRIALEELDELFVQGVEEEAQKLLCVLQCHPLLSDGTAK
jgi:hypothetical protein